jgi:nitroimidazol reductase NimA-like FMN-containing flavoprotein (pyridoxamine 5'-phosphate oxidase superfamily)
LAPLRRCARRVAPQRGHARRVAPQRGHDWGRRGVSADRTKITRLRDKERTERDELDALLDSARVGHFGLVDPEGHPVVIPTAIVRDGDRVLAHGSTGSRWMRLLAAGAPTCLAVTSLDGLVVARSAFESSLHYRSAVLFGHTAPVPDTARQHALDLITEALLPGRTAEIRRPTARELQATLVLALPIIEWSLKVSAGWPDDLPEDVQSGSWAGVVPFVTGYGDPRPAPDLRAGIPVPPSVRALADEQPDQSAGW